MFSSSFLKTINNEFIEISRKSLFSCPSRLWPHIFGPNPQHTNLIPSKDESSRYWLLVTDIYEELKNNNDVMLLLSQDLQNWITRARSCRIHRGEPKRMDTSDKLFQPLENKYKPKNTEIPVDMNTLLDLILEIDKIHNFDFWENLKSK